VLHHGDPAPVAVYREQGKKGRVFRTSLAGYDSARKQALQRKTSLFGHGLYGIGPHPELIGKAVSALGSRLAPAQASLNAELTKALQNVDPKGAFVPANLAGLVTGMGRGTPLALALNGRVAAVGWSAQLNGDNRVYFSFFAPPEDFQKGRNSARIYKIEG
jgi:hypothetical protein